LASKTEEELGGLWSGVVEHYSAASLTDPLDKLRAIANLAKVYCEERTRVKMVQTDELDSDDEPLTKRIVETEKYAAGLRVRSFPGTLLWRRKGNVPLQPVMNPFRAPTWSWACYDGPVRFPLRALADSGNLCEVESVLVNLVDKADPYGLLKSASITLKAAMLPVLSTEQIDDLTWKADVVMPTSSSSLEEEEDRKATRKWILPFLWDDLHPNANVNLHFDSSSTEQDRGNISLVLIRYGLDGTEGLILRPNDNRADTWVRLGMWESKRILRTLEDYYREKHAISVKIF